MLMLIWKNISRRRTQSVLTVAITLLTVFVFVMVMGIYQTMNTGLELSRQTRYCCPNIPPLIPVIFCLPLYRKTSICRRKP